MLDDITRIVEVGAVRRGCQFAGFRSVIGATSEVNDVHRRIRRKLLKLFELLYWNCVTKTRRIWPVGRHSFILVLQVESHSVKCSHLVYRNSLDLK